MEEKIGGEDSCNATIRLWDTAPLADMTNASILSEVRAYTLDKRKMGRGEGSSEG